ncbi:hypothetical protein SAMN02745216_04644 [Desulfatibacillum alkenivorans DSM 16219]|uniref:VCBS repeat-containing protein n=1 Tax=Desulfatibacillum alkenivorans DSM 16219 TaxID=1121393 RepID=A0A1M6Y0M5_9BACT|nr:hypothetical protein [Desulfatibacillum alkenivorans]SHL11708.1 hypothetical protein SAMN02745216_04644 [Desulfatibacillum alkenivorans DSM 16219]
MKIQQANLDLKSFRTYTERTEKRESLRIQMRDGSVDAEEGEAQGPKDTVSLSDLAKDLAKGAKQVKKAAVENQTETLSEILAEEAEYMEKEGYLVKMLLETLFGKKIKLKTLSDFMKEVKQPEGVPVEGEAPIEEGAAPDWGIQYKYHESYYEKEATSFSAQGEIKTADGRSINFSLNLVMQREYYTEENFEFRAGTIVDPLVINFNAPAASLTSSKFSFDLDADGDMENVSTLARGSGFLALDKNQDGMINDGGELFGPTTGNGFEELAQYDDDGNNWIDESDAVFGQLRVWTVDGEGNQTLQSLKEANVGAISTSGLTTQFDIKDQDNELQGKVRQTGVFVKETGEVATVQQVDMAV